LLTRFYTNRIAAICCQLLGLNVVNVRSSHNPKERSDAVDDFTGNDTDADVFISSITVSGTGLNLHQKCHNGIIIQLPCSLDKLNQAFGRLERVGQKFPVHWTVIMPRDTFCGWQEHRLVRK
jgi:SNF2 family DNA or RNA helicase